MNTFAQIGGSYKNEHYRKNLNTFAQIGGSYKNEHYRKRMGCYGLDSSGSGEGQVVDCSELGHELTRSTIHEKGLALPGELMVKFSP